MVSHYGRRRVFLHPDYDSAGRYLAAAFIVSVIVIALFFGVFVIFF